MAAHASLSDSIQASVILSQQFQRHQVTLQQQLDPVSVPGVATPLLPQHQQRRLQQQQQQHQQQQRQQFEQPRVGWGAQLLLCSSSFGTEMCIAFQFVYCILSLQYLGVPVSLSTLNAVISGCVSALLLPLVGFWTDRGPNPERRKLVPVLMGGVIYITGHLLLIMGALVKIYNENQAFAGSMVTASSTTTKTPNISTMSEESAPVVPSATDSVNGDAAWTPVVAALSGGVPASGVLGITGMCMLDVGYDMSMSVTRAFILQVVPVVQHTQVLITATLLMGVGGVTLSVFGLVDLPEFLQSHLHVDGVAALLVVLCGVMIVIVTLTYALNVGMGYFVLRDIARASEQEPQGTAAYLKPEVAGSKGNVSDDCDGKRERGLKHYLTSHGTIDEACAFGVEPAPVGSQYTNTNTLGLSVSTASLVHAPDTDYAIVNFMNPHRISSQTSINESVSICSWRKDSNFLEVSGTERNEEDAESPVGDDKERLVPSRVKRTCRAKEDGLEHEEDTVGSIIPIVDAVLVALSSLSVSIIHSEPAPLGDFHNRKLAELQRKKTYSAVETTKVTRKALPKSSLGISKRLLILLVVQFFAAGSLTSTVVFAANTLTVEIYHGDPAAPPGTVENINYQSGMKMASMGTLLYYITYLVGCILNKKVIDQIGPRAEFLVAGVVTSAVTLAYITTKRVEMFLATMVCTALYKCVVYTAPFLLAWEYSQDGEAADSGPSQGQQQKNLGRVMSYIGLLFPVHYLLVGCVMGPLMDAAHSAWVPMYYITCIASLSSLFTIPLFLVKK